uniref:ladderlectin-like n=1 Tax=Epinephelus lanceolatus TaxID=310571 RepID=UPI001446F6DC|nr:ladderlectin-like [Epinephelus lanceolatus]
MKMLAVPLFVCAMMALTRAAAERHEVKRSTCCPSDWSEIHGRCFRYVPTAMSWAKAEKNCQSIGGNLASVHSLKEYQEIQRLIVAAGHHHQLSWIGGTDAPGEGVWLWSDGSEFTYLHRSDGQPDNLGRKQHCIQMNFGAKKRWDDLNCLNRLPFVCARKM